MSAATTINAPAQIVFDVLADPTTHPAIDGTGWVRESLDGPRLTETGQIFRMAMYHDNHPDKTYEMANKVVVHDPPHAIAWEPGQDVEGDGNLSFGGWIWRYDLKAWGRPRRRSSCPTTGRRCRNICARSSSSRRSTSSTCATRSVIWPSLPSVRAQPSFRFRCDC